MDVIGRHYPPKLEISQCFAVCRFYGQHHPPRLTEMPWATSPLDNPQHIALLQEYSLNLKISITEIFLSFVLNLFTVHCLLRHCLCGSESEFGLGGMYLTHHRELEGNSPSQTTWMGYNELFLSFLQVVIPSSPPQVAQWWIHLVENPRVPGSRLARVCGSPWGVAISTLVDE